MNRTMKYAVVLVAGVALGLFSVKIAVCADAPADTSAKASVSWDEGAPLAGGPPRMFAQRGDDDFGRPGPPRDGGRGHPGRPGMGGRMAAPGAGAPGNAEGGPRRAGGMPCMSPETPGRPGMGPGMRFGMGRGIEALKDRDPEMYKLLKEDMDFERQSRELAVQYRRASGDERAKIKQQIEDVVGKHFDARQQRRLLELKRLGSELQRLREAIDRRAEARNKLVEKRVSDLVGREDEVGF